MNNLLPTILNCMVRGVHNIIDTRVQPIITFNEGKDGNLINRQRLHTIKAMIQKEKQFYLLVVTNGEIKDSTKN